MTVDKKPPLPDQAGHGHYFSSEEVSEGSGSKDGTSTHVPPGAPGGSLARTINPRKSFFLFLLQCLILSLACYAGAASLHSATWPEDWRRVVIAAILVSNLATLPPIWLTSGFLSGRAGVNSAMIVTLWRLGTYLLVIIYWTATKWLPSEFHAKCLVGCYFPFLILESWHSIRKTNHRN